MDVFDLLAHLQDRSLVVADVAGTEPRYRLLETVRQYGRDLLASDEESPAIFERHLDYYVDLSERCAPKLRGSEQLETLALLEREDENLRTALERGTSGEGSEKALLLAANLAVFWWRQGHMAEGSEWCLRAAATTAGKKRCVLRARVLNAAALLLLFQGDSTKAKELYDESHSILTELGDRQYLPEVLCGIGFSLFFLDDYVASEKVLAQASAAAIEVQDLWYQAWSGYMRGIIWRINGDFDGAMRSYQEALQIFKKLGDGMGASYPTYDIGLAQYYRGNLQEAEKYLASSLAIRRQANDLWGVSESLFGLGLVAVATKDFDSARSRLLESKEVAKQVSDKTRQAICAHWLGHIAIAEGDLQSGIAFHNESLAIYESLEDRWGLAHCLAGYASIAAADGKWTDAVRLWSMSDKVREDIGSPLPPVERSLRNEQLKLAREQVTVETFDQLWNEGREMDLPTALTLARSFDR